MKKEEVLSKEFLSQFKNSGDLFSFMKDLQKRGIEQFLEADLDEHLGYQKNQLKPSKNSRIEHSTNKIQTSLGEDEILVLRDRDSSFDPVVVPKRKNTVDGLESIIISLYARGMSLSDIEEQISDLYGFEISSSAISRITDQVISDIVAWQNRPLESPNRQAAEQALEVLDRKWDTNTVMPSKAGEQIGMN